MLLAVAFASATAVQNGYVHRMMRLVLADKTRDPTKCLAEMFENYQSITNCASRTCTCAGGTWSTAAPYCTGESISCDAATKCFPVGNQCLKSLAPDCDTFFEQGCQQAATAAGCSPALCTANATKATRKVDVVRAKRGHAVASKVLAALRIKNAAKGAALLRAGVAAPPSVTALEQILEGLVEGIEGQFGNITRCIPEEDGAFQDLEKFVSEIGDAIATGNRAEAADAFNKLIAAVSLAQRAAADCGLDDIAADLATIVAELETPGGWLKLLEQDGWKIIVNAKDVTADLNAAVTDWRSSQYNSFGQDVGRILALLL